MFGLTIISLANTEARTPLQRLRRDKYIYQNWKALQEQLGKVESMESLLQWMEEQEDKTE